MTTKSFNYWWVYVIHYRIVTKIIHDTCNKFIWATTWQNQQSDSAQSENLDQPGNPLYAWRKLGSLATY